MSNTKTMARVAQATPAQTNGPSEERDPAGALVKHLTAEVARALPGAMGADRYARMLLTALRKTPKLLDCNRASLAAAIMECAQLGLEPGREAYLIPYKSECQLQIDYRGRVKLALVGGIAKAIRAAAVCENDRFEWEEGLTPVLRHAIDVRSPRGEVIAAYAVADMGGGAQVACVLTSDDLRRIKAMARGTDRSDSPWKLWPEEMAKKSAVKRLCKLLPQSPESLRADEVDGAVMRGYRVVETSAGARTIDTDYLPGHEDDERPETRVAAPPEYTRDPDGPSPEEEALLR